MTLPLQVLLAFAGWTILTLCVGVGLARWTLILTGRARLDEFPADRLHEAPARLGPRWEGVYRRAMRAHANCVENLPVYTAVVVVLTLTGTGGPGVDALAGAFMTARLFQTTLHVALEETPRTVGLRFAFFATQLACLAGMGLQAP